jgi:hypothetical protein
MRDKREQNLTLTLPGTKDSGNLLEDTLDFQASTAETEQAINRVGEEIAHLSPAILEKVQQQAMCSKDMEKRFEDSQRKLQEQREKLQERQQEREQKLRHELAGEWVEI